MTTECIWTAETQQRVFRELTNAFARPGEIRDLAPHIESVAAERAVLATLVDGEVSLADPHGRVDGRDWLLLQAKEKPADRARYVSADGRRAPDFHPSLGTLDSPEFGATLLIAVAELGRGPLALRLSGPGVRGHSDLRLEGLHAGWLRNRTDWVADFPLGVDWLLMDGSRIVALPRTTRVSAQEGGH